MTNDTKSAIDQLDRYVRANYPLIVIRTHEENRVTDAIIDKFATKRDDLQSWVAREIFQWKVTTGLSDSDLIGLDADDSQEPYMVLRALCEMEATHQPRMFIFKDLHHHIGNDAHSAGNPRIIRALRDLAEKFSKSPHCAIFISPEFTIPTDLEKTVAVLDWPLPSYNELADIVERIEKRLPEYVPIELNGNRQKVIQALQGLTAFEATSALLNAVAATRAFGEDIVPYIIIEKKQVIRQTGVLEFYETEVTMKDVGGLENIKDYAAKKRKSFDPAASDFGVEPAKGVLLAGVPGTGKSLSAKAIGGGVMPLLRVDVGALFGGIVGESERNTRTLFRMAKAVAPCVLWFDEIEKGLGSSRGELDGGTSSRVLGTILTGMQETEEPVYFVATANDVTKLRPELVRRFDDTFFVDLPNAESRKEVFEIHLRKRNRNPEDFDLDKLAEITYGYTGAEIEKVVRAALETAYFNNDADITNQHLGQAVTEIVPLSITMSAQIDALRKWSEDAQAKQASGKIEKQSAKKGDEDGERTLEI